MPFEPRSSRNHVNLRKRVQEHLKLRKRLNFYLPLLLFFVFALTAFGLQTSNNKNPSTTTISAVPSIQSLKPQLQSNIKALSSSFNYDRLSTWVHNQLTALSKPGSTILEDYPTILAGSTQKISGVATAAWAIEGTGAFVNFYAKPDEILGSLFLGISDANGHLVAYNQQCHPGSAGVCIEHFKTLKGMTYVVLLADQKEQAMSVNVRFESGVVVPQRIQGFKLVAATDTKLRIRWDDPNPQGVAKAFLVQMTDKDGYWIDAGLSTTTETIIGDLKPLTRAYVRVIALNRAGDQSEPSADYFVQTYGNLSSVQNFPLPSGLSRWLISGNGSPSEFIWHSNSNLLKTPRMMLYSPFGVKLADNYNPSTRKLASILDIPAFSADEQLIVRIEASHVSSYIGSVTYRLKDTQPPTVPYIKSIDTRSVYSPQISLAWTASSDNTGVSFYQIERDSSVSYSTSSLSFEDTNPMKIGETHYYRVRAVDESGQVSAWSIPASITTRPGQYTLYVPQNIMKDHYLRIPLERGYNYPYQFTRYPKVEDSDVPGFAMVNFDPVFDADIKEIYLVSSYSYYTSEKLMPIPGGLLHAGSYYYNGTTWVAGKPGKRQVTIYYPAYQSSMNPVIYIHYRLTGKSWTAAPGVKMTDMDPVTHYVSLVIPLQDGQSVEEAAFFNDNGEWDNNGGKNYRITEGTWTMFGGALKPGVPGYDTPTNQTVSIAYCDAQPGEQIYMHYRMNFGGWTYAPGALMYTDQQQPPTCRFISFMLSGNKAIVAESAFYNASRRSWDNNNGKNYTFTAGRYLVMNRTVTKQ